MVLYRAQSETDSCDFYIVGVFFLCVSIIPIFQNMYGLILLMPKEVPAIDGNFLRIIYGVSQTLNYPQY